MPVRVRVTVSALEPELEMVSYPVPVLVQALPLEPMLEFERVPVPALVPVPKKREVLSQVLAAQQPWTEWNLRQRLPHMRPPRRPARKPMLCLAPPKIYLQW